MVKRHLLGDCFQVEKTTKTVEDIIDTNWLTPFNIRLHPTILIIVYKGKVFSICGKWLMTISM